MSITAQTRLFVLLGDPVAHSLSPVIQNAAFAAAGVDGAYTALRCTGPDVVPLIRAIAQAGGGGNITAPHKEQAVRALDVPSAAVEATGACNTFWLEDGRVCGDNTDVAGFTAAARRVAPALRGADVLLIGAGGAARAVLHALLEGGVAHIWLVNRSAQRAAQLAARLDPDGTRVSIATPHTIERLQFGLVVNATPLGMHTDDPLPIDLSRLGRPGAVVDVVYRPGGTEFVRRATALGMPATDGLEMLIEQGAAAFVRWWRQPAPVAAMRAAIP